MNNKLAKTEEIFEEIKKFCSKSSLTPKELLYIKISLKEAYLKGAIDAIREGINED